MEVTCVSAGLGYNDLEHHREEVSHLPKGYHGRWDRVCGAKAWEMETSNNPSECIKFFNCSTVLYIQQHVYIRMKGNNRSNFTHKFAALFVSAFIHGFYPIYYITFAILALVNEISAEISKIHFDSYIPRILQLLIGGFTTRLMFCYLLSPHFTVENHKAYVIAASLNFVPYYMIMVGFVFVLIRRSSAKKVKQN
mmetsp:Transcript_4746/g.4406  ORF Transcript_4746/g.4406 Transcript_4746/m.4406 type:complete len:195 (-) Transcript_4746:40-624(-)